VAAQNIARDSSMEVVADGFQHGAESLNTAVGDFLSFPAALCGVNGRARPTNMEALPRVGDWLNTKRTQGSEGPEAVFCYGSYGIQQMRVLCQRPDLQARRAMLPNASRVFADASSEWGGAVASIIPLTGSEVRGSIVELSAAELVALDAAADADMREPYAPSTGVRCRRQDVVVLCEGKALEAVTYVLLDLKWKGPPSDHYLAACLASAEGCWPSEDRAIEVRDGAGQLRDTVSVRARRRSGEHLEPRLGEKTTALGPGIGRIDQMLGDW